MDGIPLLVDEREQWAFADEFGQTIPDCAGNGAGLLNVVDAHLDRSRQPRVRLDLVEFDCQMGIPLCLERLAGAE
jgi:hypothetical protein